MHTTDPRCVADAEPPAASPQGAVVGERRASGRDGPEGPGEVWRLLADRVAQVHRRLPVVADPPAVALPGDWLKALLRLPAVRSGQPLGLAWTGLLGAEHAQDTVRLAREAIVATAGRSLLEDCPGGDEAPDQPLAKKMDSGPQVSRQGADSSGKE